jgi:hypothetical protein
VNDELTEDEFEKFKWNVLGDAAFEDYYVLWELGWEPFAERALRELHDEGLIYFFRVPPPYDVNTSGEDEGLRLPPEEVDETLRGDWWREGKRLPEEHPNIWFGPTPAGEAACENPPEHIRKLWRLDERSPR